MGEAEVIKSLKNFNEPVPARVIAEDVKVISRCSVDTALQRLRNRGEIKSVMKKVKGLKPIHHYFL